MHAMVVCICGVHNEPGFATIVKELLLLGLLLCFRAKMSNMRMGEEIRELESAKGSCQ